MKIETAPFEVASNPRAEVEGEYLYLDGKKYLRPILTKDSFNKIAGDIRSALIICDNNCRGLTRLWHKITRNVGHKL
jgi:hypothetical protein